MGGAYPVGAYQPRITQHPKMVRHAGLGPPTAQLIATGFGHPRQTLHYLEAYWVAKRVKYALHDEVIGIRMLKGFHACILYSDLYFLYSSNIIEL